MNHITSPITNPSETLECQNHMQLRDSDSVYNKLDYNYDYDYIY